MVHEAIAEKLRAMNSLSFDLSDLEIEDFQDIIGSNSDDEAYFDDPDFESVEIIPHDAEMPKAMNGSEIDPAIFNEGQEMLSSSMNQKQQDTGIQNIRQVLSPIPEDVEENEMTFEWIPENAEMPKAINGSKIDPALFEKGQTILSAKNMNVVQTNARCNNENSSIHHEKESNGHLKESNGQVIDRENIFESNPAIQCVAQNENVSGGQNNKAVLSEVDFVLENIKAHIPSNYECVYDTVSIQYSKPMLLFSFILIQSN